MSAISSDITKQLPNAKKALYDSYRSFLENYDVIVAELETICNIENLALLREFAYKYATLNYSPHMTGPLAQYDLYPEFQKKHPNFVTIAAKLKELLRYLQASIGRLVEQGPSDRAMTPRPGHWNPDQQENSGSHKIYFIHGGTIRFLLKFFKGETEGYRLEKGGLGIQVHPFRCKDDPKVEFFMARSKNDYAKLRAAATLDYPALLTGTIEAQYLDAATNGYEAGLRIDFISKIEAMKIELLPQQGNYFTELPSFPVLCAIYQLTQSMDFLRHAPDEFKADFIKQYDKLQGQAGSLEAALLYGYNHHALSQVADAKACRSSPSV